MNVHISPTGEPIPPTVGHHPEKPRSFCSGLTLAIDTLPIVWN